MQRVLWIITIVCSLLAFLQFGYTMVEAESSPQQAAGAAIALAFAVIPYVLSRAMAELNLLPPKKGPFELDDDDEDLVV